MDITDVPHIDPQLRPYQYNSCEDCALWELIYMEESEENVVSGVCINIFPENM